MLNSSDQDSVLNASNDMDERTEIEQKIAKGSGVRTAESSEDATLNLWDPSSPPPFIPAGSRSIAQDATRKSASGVGMFVGVELARVRAVAGLWEWLKNDTERRGLDVHTPSFERWLTTTRHLQVVHLKAGSDGCAFHGPICRPPSPPPLPSLTPHPRAKNPFKLTF